MMRVVFWFRIARITTICFAIVGYWGMCLYFLSMLALVLDHANKLTGSSFGVLTGIVLFTPVGMVWFLWNQSSNLLDAWIEQNWVTADFKEEVDSIREINKYQRGMDCFVGTGTEVKVRGRLPSHVSEDCDQSLLNLAKEVKRAELDRRDQMLVEGMKGRFKASYELFERYSILPGGKDIRAYYQQAGELVKEERMQPATVR
jgi:hypothetical protein